MTSSYKTRMDRVQEEKSSHFLYFSIISGLIILVAGGMWGVPALITMSTFIGNISQKNEASQQTENVILFPPTLNPITEATNSSPIKISGFSDPGNSIELFLNDTLDDKTSVNDAGQFVFENVNLKEGLNTVFVKAIKKEKTSDKSQSFQISYLKKAPKLEINKPENDQVISTDRKETTVNGLTDPGNTVTVNDHFAIVNPDGSFSYNAVLNDGDNILVIEASDKAGNKTKTERKVKYSAPS